MNDLGYLKNIPLFAGFNARDLRRVEATGTRAPFRRGEKIFDEDTAGDRLYVVLSGRVKIFASSGLRKKTLAYLEKGEFFGEMALLDRELRSASSLASEDCELLVIKKKDFQRLLERYPRISLRIMKTLSRRLRRADREIESLSFGHVLGRVASTLLELSVKYGEAADGGLRIRIPLNHRDIAEMAGTAREMVSRTLNRFRRLKCIRYDDRRLTITDVRKLKEWIY
ncbi:MAG: Crp/Fnr family transcriptional regulator [Endomicrobiales bacterium]